MKKLFVLIFSALLFCSLAAGAAPKKLKIGLFVDFGAKGNGVYHLASLIAHSPQTELVTLMAEDIRAGKLKDVDVFVMPGGNSWRQVGAIGEEHVEKVHTFLKNGGGYVGTCAGMYNVIQGKPGVRMNLLPYDRYLQGGGPTAFINVEISKEGAKIMGVNPGTYVVRYSGGPLVFPVKSGAKGGEGKTLGIFKTASARNVENEKRFFNSPAVIYGTYGKGKIIATSFHPEYWDSNHQLMLGCFYAVTGVKMTPVFPKKNPRPWRVGFVSSGLQGHEPIRAMLDLERHPDIDVEYVMQTEIEQGIMRHLDFLVLPHGNALFYKKVLNNSFVRQQLLKFMEQGGIVLASGNAAEEIPAHKNLKKLPSKVDFKKYILE